MKNKIMKAIKFILIGIFSLIASLNLLLLIALYIKKDFAVEREITINKPKQEVFDYIKYVKNLDNFGVWNMRYPNMIKYYEGIDGTVGFTSFWLWDEKKFRWCSSLEIKEIKDGERLDSEVLLMLPFQAIDHAYMITDGINKDQTKVKWGYNHKGDYTLNLIRLFRHLDEIIGNLVFWMKMEEMLGNDLKKGLENLKSNLEK
jgi:hypothetical protein